MEKNLFLEYQVLYVLVCEDDATVMRLKLIVNFAWRIVIDE